MSQLTLSSGDADFAPPIAALDVLIDAPIDELGQIVMHALEETDQLIRYVTTARVKASMPKGLFTRSSHRREAQGNSPISHDELFDSMRSRVISLHEHCLASELDAPAPHATFQHLIEIHRSGCPKYSRCTSS
jgi:hypothetical protein